MFSKLLSFHRENGSYLLLSMLARRPGVWLRNRALAAKFGVSEIRIGPQSYIRGITSMSMGAGFSAREGLWLEAVTRYGGQSFTPKLTIGDHVGVSCWCHIACTHSVTIGNHVLIGSKVIITDHNHGHFGERATSPLVPPGERPLESDRFVTIGDNVWLGDGVVVCPGVTIGEGSVIGANAVVTADVAPYTMAAGVPAKVLRHYNQDLETWIHV